MGWTATIGGQIFTEANVDGTAYADEASGFPAIITAMAQEAAFLKGVGNTSTTSLTPGTGTKTFTLGQAPGFSVGMLIMALSASDIMHYVIGDVTAINGNVIDVNVTIAIGGSAKADWVVTYPSPGYFVDVNGDLVIDSGSFSTSGADNNWAAGGNRALLDLNGAVGRFGATAGGGSAVTSEWWSNGIKIWDVDTAGAVTFGTAIQNLTSRISWLGESARTAAKQWLDQTEDLAAGGTLDAGWNQTNVTADSDYAAGPSGETLADRIVASGGAGNHVIMARRGTLNGTYGDIYTLSCYVKNADVGKIQFRIRADTYGHGAYVNIDSAAGTVLGTGVVSSGVLVDHGIVDTGAGWYRVHVTADMSAIAGAPPFVAELYLLDAANNISFTPAATAEKVLLWGAMVNGGTLADYVPNTATSGQTYGFTMASTDYDVGVHTLTADTTLYIEKAPSGKRRNVEIDLTQDGTGGWDVTPVFDHATTNLIEMNTKPVFTAQSATVKTRLIAEVAETFARVWYEVEP